MLIDTKYLTDILGDIIDILGELFEGTVPVSFKNTDRVVAFQKSYHAEIASLFCMMQMQYVFLKSIDFTHFKCLLLLYFQHYLKCSASQPAITCSKLTVETLKQDVKYIQN